MEAGNDALLRPSVAKFAEQMERVLRENDYKGGWEFMLPDRLLDRMWSEMRELEFAFRHAGAGTAAVERNLLESVCDEAIDVANFAMMMCEQMGEIPPPPR